MIYESTRVTATRVKALTSKFRSLTSANRVTETRIPDPIKKPKSAQKYFQSGERDQNTGSDKKTQKSKKRKKRKNEKEPGTGNFVSLFPVPFLPP